MPCKGTLLTTDSSLEMGNSEDNSKMIVGLSLESVQCCVAFKIYNLEVEFQANPKQFQKLRMLTAAIAVDQLLINQYGDFMLRLHS
jgi:hypothetical protein